MRKVLKLIVAAVGPWILLSGMLHAQEPEKRIALVIGNRTYANQTLQSAANDAGLVAQTLQAAGFEVNGARDLDAATLRSSLREFVDKASGSGSQTIALVYFSGFAVQFEGENYLVPIDAPLLRDSDIPLQAIRVTDVMKPLSALKLKASIIILDAARANKFAANGQPLAGGLALIQPDVGMLVASNAAPGTVGHDTHSDYGAYAKALCEMIREGGLQLNELFDRVRLRVADLPQGSELPWFASRVQAPLVFFERTSTAPAAEQDHFAQLRSKPIREFEAREAYLAALAHDTMQVYSDFLAAYPNDPLAKRVRVILAARREAVIWRETVLADTPDAYWSYLRRYARGPHAYDARRRLLHLAANLEPPPSFTLLSYDVPPPPPEEIIFVERPYVYFADPVYALPLPPPIPIVFLAPVPAYWVDLPPPPPPIGLFVLPFPVYRPVPIWVERPAYVLAPATNVISVNIHNTVVINQASNSVVVTNAAGQQVAPFPATSQPKPGQSALNPSQIHPTAAATGAALPAAAVLRARQAPPSTSINTTPEHALPKPATTQTHALPRPTPTSTGRGAANPMVATGSKTEPSANPPPSVRGPGGASPLSSAPAPRNLARIDNHSSQPVHASGGRAPTLVPAPAANKMGQPRPQTPATAPLRRVGTSISARVTPAVQPHLQKAQATRPSRPRPPQNHQLRP